MTHARYALYFAPDADHPLTAKAEAWLGYSAWSFADIEQIAPDGIAQSAFAQLTAAPRKYGFHGTLKPPFRLSEGTSENDLVDAVQDAVATLHPVMLQALVTRFVGPFLALVAEASSGDLNDLAGDIVKRFEPFRAPLNEAEMERRLRSPLTERQQQHLAQWGYPYVFDEFRFHMTLTGPVPDDQREAIDRAAREHFSDVGKQPFPVDRLAIFKQPDPERPFYVLRSFALGRSERAAKTTKTSTLAET